MSLVSDKVLNACGSGVGGDPRNRNKRTMMDESEERCKSGLLAGPGAPPPPKIRNKNYRFRNNGRNRYKNQLNSSVNGLQLDVREDIATGLFNSVDGGAFPRLYSVLQSLEASHARLVKENDNYKAELQTKDDLINRLRENSKKAREFDGLQRKYEEDSKAWRKVQDELHMRMVEIRLLEDEVKQLKKSLELKIAEGQELRLDVQETTKKCQRAEVELDEKCKSFEELQKQFTILGRALSFVLFETTVARRQEELNLRDIQDNRVADALDRFGKQIGQDSNYFYAKFGADEDQKSTHSSMDNNSEYSCKSLSRASTAKDASEPVNHSGEHVFNSNGLNDDYSSQGSGQSESEIRRENQNGWSYPWQSVAPPLSDNGSVETETETEIVDLKPEMKDLGSSSMESVYSKYNLEAFDSNQPQNMLT